MNLRSSEVAAASSRRSTAAGCCRYLPSPLVLFVLILMGLIAVPGCGGCWGAKSSPTAKAKKKKDEKAKDEDDAEAILLGCAGFAQFANELEGELHIPVLDGVVCAVKMTEAVVELGKSTSKYKTYRFPEGKAFSGMLAKFAWTDRER